MSSKSTTCVKTSDATYSSAVQPKMRCPDNMTISPTVKPAVSGLRSGGKVTRSRLNGRMTCSTPTIRLKSARPSGVSPHSISVPPRCQNACSAAGSPASCFRWAGVAETMAIFFVLSRTAARGSAACGVLQADGIHGFAQLRVGDHRGHLGELQAVVQAGADQIQQQLLCDGDSRPACAPMSNWLRYITPLPTGTSTNAEYSRRGPHCTRLLAPRVGFRYALRNTRWSGPQVKKSLFCRPAKRWMR